MPGILTALTLAGCKDDQGTASQPSDQASQPAQSTTPGSPTPAPVSATPTPPAGNQPPPGSGGTKLTITVRMSPTADPITRTLTCDPAGGTAPDAATVCTQLTKVAAVKGGDPFAPTPKGQMCTQIYGGPQTATIKGTYKGKPVDTTFGRKNGCETKRWNDLAALFGPLAHTPTH
ncbi:SSI family serine proteinase inhibitor [Actinomadura sp. DC4]|uniref:SSI family serine proteinase inhibitor n=1 Tax=Actinomadura sp. DC4 TaxID=3055069 RepID=UPI0025B20403|nr:SSI family serine proteinase inhibitor [Actinomadura sp. DC4]MDN3352965.1 SSI family serine proteinase inhibitor [Actinomadura sp. DC4]